MTAEAARNVTRMLEAASFKGRFDWAVIRRAAWSYGLLVGGAIVFSWIFKLSGFPIAAKVISGIGAATLGILLISVAVRRLHNRGLSGWLLPVFFGPHFALLLAMERLDQSGASEDALTLTFLLGGLIAFPLFIWGMFETFLTKGKPGPNRFGPDPRAPTPPLATTSQIP